MNGNPIISIVLPTYNGSRYLAGAIASICAQTFTDWELILVDDCSTDTTPHIIADAVAKDGRIRAIRNATNQRLPRSLNIGFQQAKGSLFTWTSDDNEYRPDALQAMSEFLREKPEVGVVYCDAMDIDGDGRDLELRCVDEPRELACRNVVHACFLYRREVHEALGGYDPSLFLVEDWDFWLRASIQFRLGTLHRDLYRYRWHSESLTAKRADEVRRTRVRLMEQRVPQLPWLDSSGKRKAYLAIARGFGEMGDRLGERRYNSLALSHGWFAAAPVIFARALLGYQRAGAVVQWLRAIRRKLG
jgi:glycosyltransferase involved in cell wall biosynthesis